MVGCILYAWQVNSESGAFSDLTVRENEASGLLHDAIHSREPKSRSFALLFRREERFKDPRLRFLIHSRPGVRNRQQNVRPRWNQRMLSAARIQFDALALNENLAPTGHRIASIHHQVHDYLLQLACVCTRVTHI